MKFLHTKLTRGLPISINVAQIENIHPMEIVSKNERVGRVNVYDDRCIIVMAGGQRMFEVDEPYPYMVELMRIYDET